MTAGKVAVYAVMSIYANGAGRERNIVTGMELIGSGLDSWRRYGMPALTN
jgi:hypothetical protein